MKRIPVFAIALVLLIAGAAQAQNKRARVARVPRTPGQVVQVRLSQQPLAKIRASFDADDGSHAAVEWDPVVPASLTRAVRLDPGKPWYLSFTSEQVPVGPSQASQAAIYVFTSTSPPITSQVRLEVTHVTTPNPATVGKVTAQLTEMKQGGAALGPAIQISVKVEDLPDLTRAKSGLAPGPSTGAQGRSLEDTVPAGVAELFQVIAEIAFDRAKSKAFAILTQRIQRFLCEELVWTPEINDKVFHLPASFITDQDKKPAPILPNTCELARHLRLQDLVNSAQAALFAFLDDLTLIGLEVAIAQLPGDFPQDLKDVIQKTAPFLVDLAAGRTAVSTREAQLVLVALSQVEWGKALDLDYFTHKNNAKPSDVDRLACGLDLGFAVIATCHAKGGCDAREIGQMLTHYEQYFSLDPAVLACLAGDPAVPDVPSIAEQWPDLDLLVSRALDLIAPPPGTTPQTMARSAVNLLLDIAERVQCVGRPSRSCRKSDPVALMLEGLRQLALGIINHDAAAATVAGAHLVQGIIDRVVADCKGNGDCARRNGDIGKALAKVTALVGAVIAYAQTYQTGGKPDSAAAHTARKKAIESLMDAATDRTQRDGDFVVSLGVAVGFQGGGQFTFGDQGANEGLYPQLTLPIGVAAQWLPKKGQVYGWHLQLSALDLAQFVSYRADGSVNPPRWDSFVTAALYGGIILGSPNNTFVLGPEVRYSPTLFTPSGQSPTGGALRVSLLLTYYVPFFDFN